MKLFLTALAIIFSVSSVFSQQPTKWYFANGSGIDFSTNPATTITGGPTTDDLSPYSTITDANNDVFFITDGTQVWDASFTLMPSGNSLSGSAVAGEVLVFKQPSVDSVYYIVHSDGPTGGVEYSIVDLRLTGNGGAGNPLGDLSSINQPILASGVKRISACRHSNGVDLWVICHEWNSADFHVWLATSSGFASSSIETIGSSDVTIGGPSPELNAAGQMKVSPNNSLLAVTRWGDTAFQLFCFDNSTGTIGEAMSIEAGEKELYGCAWSDNGRYLYVADDSVIVQYDTWEISAAKLAASKKVIGISNDLIGALNLGPDGKIYVGAQGTSNVGVINAPNLSGTDCDFVSNGLVLSGSNENNFASVNQFFNDEGIAESAPTASFVFSTGCTSKVDFTATINNADSYYWDFGDPVSGNKNHSFEVNPTHDFSGGGDFTVKLFYKNNCVVDSVAQLVSISEIESIKLPESIWSCVPKTITIDASMKSASYVWNDGSTDSVLTIKNSGTYWVDITLGACSRRDTIDISFDEFDTGFEEEYILCEEDSLVLDGTLNISEHVNYSWPPNLTTDSIATLDSSAVHYYNATYISDNNLVVNGDFELGDSAFTSDFNYNCPSFGDLVEDNYCISTNPSQLFSAAQSNCKDHSGSGNAMVFNPSAGNYGQNLWCQNIDVAPNTNYILTVWMQLITYDIASSPDLAKMQFSINGQLVTTSDSASVVNCSWKRMARLWNSGSNTNIDFCITNLQNGAADFSIDDVSIQQICTVKDTFDVQIKPPSCFPPHSTLVVPTVFTPNGDGYNDFLLPISTESVEDLSVAIYNRWGEIVYETSDLPFAWDGKKEGVDMNDGVYYWTANIQRTNVEGRESLSGYFHLMR